MFDANNSTPSDNVSSPATASSASNASGTRSPKSDYFVAPLCGFAYLNDIREVSLQGKRAGKAFISTRVKIMQGPRTDPTPLRINCNVFGDALKEVLRPYLGTLEKVTALVSISDISIDSYQRTDKETGETTMVPCAYGRLYGIRRLWVANKLVYSSAPAPSAAPNAPAASDGHDDHFDDEVPF